MKTFASVLLIAAFADAKKHKTMPVVVPEPEPVIEVDPEVIAEQEFWQGIENKNGYGRNLWEGVYQGLYGMSSKVERPDENCFGEWIPSHMHELDEFRQTASESIWMIDVEEAKKVSYDVVDLIFLNDQYCHFRTTYWNVHTFCKESESCDFQSMMENMQKNAFGIITQMSTAASIFKEQKWEDMDQDGREYALNQMGHALAALYADLIGFSATKMAALLQ